ncbi:class I SAM-dependent methyltransferase [Roseibium aggregatum]|uniref:class I SAM-dependent methyltransferase n=1 Tax=Roseibium aggregatum TaxID=187304 RepID=UPI003A9704E1
MESSKKIDPAERIQNALRELRASVRAYRRETGKAASPLLSGGAPMVSIRNELVVNSVCTAQREFLLPLVPQGGIACEVGTSTGFFARAIAMFTKPAELHTIDMDYSRFKDSYFEQDSGLPAPIKHEGRSWEELSKFDKYFDLIYIDAGHSYKDVTRDIEAASKAIKPDGYLMFNDYCRWSIEQAEPYGVLAAVNDFANENNWAVRGVALSGSGHFDILLSKNNDVMNARNKEQVEIWKTTTIEPPEKEPRRNS